MRNKHESSSAKEVADENTILRTVVGSSLLGCGVDEQDDRYEMGVCVEPPQYLLGVANFEQYQFRTQPEGHRSGPGDLDLVVYSLRKWARLAAKGNPTVLLLLWAPEDGWVTGSAMARDLQAHAPMFLSKDCGRRFLGYLESQKSSMVGEKSRRVNRPELIEKYGYDTKFAYHAVRLGMQGCELFENGKLSLPMQQSDRGLIRLLRGGGVPQSDAIQLIDYYHSRLQFLLDSCDWPDHADYANINRWLVDTYQMWWLEKGLVL